MVFTCKFPLYKTIVLKPQLFIGKLTSFRAPLRPFKALYIRAQEGGQVARRRGQADPKIVWP